MLGSVVAYQSWQYPMCLWVMPVDFRMVIPPWGSLEDTHPDTWHPGLIVIEYQSNKHDAYRLRTLVVYLPDYTRLAQIENRIKAKNQRSYHIMKPWILIQQQGGCFPIIYLLPTSSHRSNWLYVSSPKNEAVQYGTKSSTVYSLQGRY